MTLPSAARAARQRWILTGVALVLLMLAAIWIIPIRVMTGENCSYYAFGYLSDEYHYAQRLQPAFAGISATNPTNGIGDPKIVSQFYLDDLCRAVLTFTHIDIAAFFWIWRFVFPIALLAATAVLVQSCLPQRRRGWSKPLFLGALALSTTLLWAGYLLLLPSPPLHNWLMRVPTNIEYVLALLLLAGFIKFYEAPRLRPALVLAGISLLTFYFRPYTTIPWAIVFTICCIHLLVTRRMRPGLAVLVVAIIAAGAAPAFVANKMNANIPTYQDWVGRYVKPHEPYGIHPRWWLQMGLGAVFAAAGLFVPKDKRPIVWSTAFVLLILPFTCGLMPFHLEMLMDSDRFGFLYLPALVMTALFLLGRQMEELRGSAAARQAIIWMRGCAAATIAGTAAVAIMNLTWDFDAYGVSNHRSCVTEIQYFDAYHWIREHTPEGSLFLVDDGIDFASLPDTSEVVATYAGQAELFLLVAKRPVVFSEGLRTYALSNDDFVHLMMLQRGTFGVHIQLDAYKRALVRYKPRYIFWRKSLPIPRGYGVQLQALVKDVKDFPTCQIWELRYE
jgi:hypothetical protein